MSWIDLPKLRVYVFAESSGSAKLMVMLLPLILDRGLLSCGGDRKIFFCSSFYMVYASKVKVMLPPLTGNPTIPESGITRSILGGIVSFGPPIGGAEVLAQDPANI